MTTVLKDILGNDFTEGDRVAYSNRSGIRVGRVDWIKVDSFGKGLVLYKVYIDLSEHHNLKGFGKMYAKKQGYQYVEHNFLKV